MGEAFLYGHESGLRFKALSASLPAPYNVFYNGQAIDISHAVITANLGKVTMQVPPGSCTFSPQTATAGLTAITISFAIGGTTRTASVPVTVLNLSNIFANNTWAQIAQAAHYGFPKYLWQPGDMKTLTIGSMTHTIRIIGFDNDPLDENDAKYNDPTYNRGTKKAALALQWYTPAGNGRMHRTNNGGNVYWENSDMRLSTLPALKASLPDDVKNNIRIVDKWFNRIYTGNGQSWTGSIASQWFNTYKTYPGILLPEELFLLNTFDSNYVNRSLVYFDDLRIDNYYQLFEHTWTKPWQPDRGDTMIETGYITGDYQSYDPRSGEWSRACEDTSDPGANLRFIGMDQIEDQLKYMTRDQTTVLPYFPVFNL